MKRPSQLMRGSRDIDMEGAMTPMIDVVFLLLVFFVWTASFQVIEQILPSQMSAQLGSDPVENIEPSPEDDFDDVVIRIGWDGQTPTWTINDQPIASLDTMKQHLTTISNIHPESLVILHPESTVPIGFVIQAYDTAKQSGFAKVSFAVNPPHGA